MTPPSTSSSAVTGPVLVAADGGDPDHLSAEHRAHAISQVLGWDASPTLTTTHLVGAPGPHVALVRAGPREARRSDDDLLAVLSSAFPGVGFAVQAAPDSSLSSIGPTLLAHGAGEALVEHRGRTSGRLVDYPGGTAIECLTTPADVIALSCIDAVEGLAGVDVRPDSPLDLTGFARPQWREGRCVLLVQQGSRALMPFEVRDQVPCCSRH